MSPNINYYHNSKNPKKKCSECGIVSVYVEKTKTYNVNLCTDCLRDKIADSLSKDTGDTA